MIGIEEFNKEIEEAMENENPAEFKEIVLRAISNTDDENELESLGYGIKLALEFSITWNDVEMVKFLINYVPDDEKTIDPESIATGLDGKFDPEILSLLIDNGFDVGISTYGDKYLNTAIGNLDISMIRYLLGIGAKISSDFLDELIFDVDNHEAVYLELKKNHIRGGNDATKKRFAKEEEDLVNRYNENMEILSLILQYGTKISRQDLENLKNIEVRDLLANHLIPNKYRYQDICEDPIDPEEVDLVEEYYRHVLGKEPSGDLTQDCKELDKKTKSYTSESRIYDILSTECPKNLYSTIQGRKCSKFLDKNKCLSLFSGKKFEDTLIGELYFFEEDGDKYCLEIQDLIQTDMTNPYTGKKVPLSDSQAKKMYLDWKKYTNQKDYLSEMDLDDLDKVKRVRNDDSDDEMDLDKVKRRREDDLDLDLGRLSLKRSRE